MTRQRTIRREISLQGRGIHTGADVQVCLKPAPVNNGIVFRRTDLLGHPEVHPRIDHIGDCVRCTKLVENEVLIITPEHLLAAVAGLGIHNLWVEMNASELPGFDGSAKLFVQTLLEAEILEQEAEVEFLSLDTPVSVSSGPRSLIALPYEGFKITCTSSDDHQFHTQHLSLEITPENFISELAPSRTFVFFEDIRPLMDSGMMQGASLDTALIIQGNSILAKEPLRFPDELVRHKILDLVGDLALLGKPLRAHIIAVRPGHAFNAQLTQKLAEHFAERASGSPKSLPTPSGPLPVLTETSMDIQKILNLLPHRYPFLMIDRVVEFRGQQELRAIKNVSINEPYFQGHFPGQAVMPGVLQIEAMAQAAGILMIREAHCENKLAYFMSCDKVKFRRAVVPGDQLEIYAKILRSRGGKIGVADCQCSVNGKVVSSAELMFTIVEQRVSH
ncbi:MAG: bifunctional UDP-3-O-[3-hydroxymyristoyl] N-acetylglucosamine deacetylase/3-hydroxyacyl-ACP dehydratase [Puniceicoccales bacterium]|jgi:UDP-3-O-[3-hydroxymyristoyl] N-acetylglucosamine deacetylase/3-hydroxyacyl-[acyl-carrier-protein] dehydratase|nr:bifunctional UDP-3-O-[3-hydroxymyristoyl] N-acetylglucosamine deacetylase/3-hydroxyacyl-ACP dehydratase [Puniceicoccales bacterium]